MAGVSDPAPRCGAKTKTRGGAECRNAAGFKTDHVGVGRCALHGGASPSGRKYAKGLQLRHAAATLGLPRDVDPHTALLEELHAAAGMVAWLRGLMAATDAGDVPAVWLEVFGEERDRYVRVAKTCADAGVEERRVRVAEQAGELVARAIGGVLAELGVADHPDAPAAVRRNLLQLGAGEGEAS